MGFRSRARARKQEKMDILGSNRDFVTSDLPDDVLSSSETDGQGTILGVVEPQQQEVPEDYKDALAEQYSGTVVETVTAKDVPEGTSNEIKEWVGDSVNRARAAYEREQEADNPRKTLIKYLNSLLDSE